MVDADRVSVAGKRFFSCIAMVKFLDALTEKVKFNDAAWKARLIFLFCIFSRPLFVFPLSLSLSKTHAFPFLSFLFSLVFSFLLCGRTTSACSCPRAPCASPLPTTP